MKKILWLSRGLAIAVLLAVLPAVLPGLDGGSGRPAATADAAARTTACGGVAAVSSTDGVWRCRFSDDFTGTTLNRNKWIVQHTPVTGWRSGRECYLNHPENVRVSGGLLSLTAREKAKLFLCETPGGGGYWTRVTSGMVTTWGRFQQTYGRWEIRARFPDVTTRGVHSALWLWPRVQNYGAWPRSGEIDIAEFFSGKPDRAIPYIHYRKARWDPSVTNTSCLIDRTRFQTYRLDWTRSTLTVSIDGKVCVRHTINPAWPLSKPAPFDKPFFLALTQALGIGQNGYSSWTTQLPATTQIDWVRVWG
ncbi:glycoside hydrolase family 16 protein [Nocardioides caeni]|uniref:glycoside hydrolase family 16 protein n=1 Tax=Nocardioides caeni TaxID=574700 RepID=UPI0036D2FB19